MKNVIACRPGCCSAPLPEAIKALREVGVVNFEVGPPQDGDYDKLLKIAIDAKVTISSLATGVKLDDPADVKRVEEVIKGSAQIGTRIIFVSISPGKGTEEQGIMVLKALASKAAAAGIVLSMETHKPYGHNGDTALKTLKAVDSPGLGFNYDTANIFYYNPKGVDGIAELKKVLSYVTSVHLKESAKGEPESFDFPVLGTGIVKFPEVFSLMCARGFIGPYTMELEGALVNGLPVPGQVAKVKECMDYLKRIGVA